VNGKDTSMINLYFEYPKNYGMLNYLYIHEENNSLILWYFIGDPDDFRPQEFMKSNQ
jgi:hypothetical protein